MIMELEAKLNCLENELESENIKKMRFLEVAIIEKLRDE